MIAADRPVQRPRGAKLLVIDRDGGLTHVARSRLVDLLRPRDLVIGNDAATLPASLHGVHVPSGRRIEARLAGRSSLDPRDVTFAAVIFGAGDFRTRTEDRDPPPSLRRGDRLTLGTTAPPLSAAVEGLLDHPRFAVLRFAGDARDVWEGIARGGRPIQYAHMREPLALWDVWTPIAALPVAFEAPSAGFALDWRAMTALRARGIGFATITVAAGISSTGDADLDRRLPFDEAYRIGARTAAAIEETRMRGGRIVAVGTTVVRALEHAGGGGVVRAGDGVADERIGASTVLRVVDVILSGTHERDSSHYQLLLAFADAAVLASADVALEAHAYRTHEFGDSVLVEKAARRVVLAPDVGRARDVRVRSAA